MARGVYTRGEHRLFEFWLVFDFDGSIRVTKGIPSCGRGERAMFLTAQLPLSLWRVPSLSAKIEFPAGTMPTELKIDVEAVADAVRSATGLDIDLRINPLPET